MSTVDGVIQVNRPNPYFGDSRNLEGWLTQIKIYFKSFSVPENKEVLFASTFLKGRAQIWFRQLLEKDLYQNEDVIDKLSFPKFEEELFRTFGNPILNDKCSAEAQTVLRRKPRAFREKLSNNHSKLCYTCGKPGHLARNCHNSVQGQLNSTLIRKPYINNDKDGDFFSQQIKKQITSSKHSKVTS